MGLCLELWTDLSRPVWAYLSYLVSTGEATEAPSVGELSGSNFR